MRQTHLLVCPLAWGNPDLWPRKNRVPGDLLTSSQKSRNQENSEVSAKDSNHQPKKTPGEQFLLRILATGGAEDEAGGGGLGGEKG